MARKLNLKTASCTIKQQLRARGIDFAQDFHALRSREVDLILAGAVARGYKKPINAPGSRARMFYQALQRKHC